MRKRKAASPSGIALSLSLSEWSRRQLQSNMRAQFPRASLQTIQDRVYRYLTELDIIRRRARFRRPRRAR